MAKLPGPAESLPVPQGSRFVPNAPVDPTGAQLSRSGAQLTRAAGQLQQAFEEEKRRIDKTRVEEAFTELKREQIRLSLGEEDGFAQVKGGEAVKRPVLQDWSDKFENVRTEIGKNLQNDEQRRAFNLRADAAQTQFSEDILRHLNTQNNAYQKDVKNATIEVEAQTAGLRWQNPHEVNASLVRTKAAVNAYAEANGIEGVVLDAMRNDAVSKIHTSVIAEALTNKNPAYAKMWFDAHRKEIDEPTALKLQTAIEEGNLRANAQQKTDEIVLGNDPKTAMEKAREIKDPELRDEVVRRVKGRISENQALQTQVENNAQDEAWKLVVDGASRDDIPETVWSNMSGAGRRQVVDYLASSKPRTTDLGAYYEMKGLLLQDQDQARSYLFKNINKFSQSDAKGFINELTDPPEMPNVLSNKGAFDTAVEELIGPKPSSSKTTSRKEWAERYNVLLGLYQTELNDWHADHPGQKKIPDEDRRKILDGLMIRANKKRGLFGMDILWPDKDIDLSTIPVEDMEAIQASLERQGLPVTAENILKVFVSAND